MSGSLHRTETEFALELAFEAGRITLGYFQTGVEVDLKTDGSPVTRADREAEQHLRRRLAARYPADGVVGEEFGIERPDAARRWILDPIDGTKSFARGVPLYGVMLALEVEGISVLGVLHFPALNETIWATRGDACWWNGRPARVSSVDTLARAVVLTSDVNGMDRAGHGAAFRRVTQRCAYTRTWGDCYGHALVATGRAEAIFDPKLALWDAAPLLPIIEMAGGSFTTLDGRATHTGGDGVATNAALAAEFRRLFHATEEA